MLELIKQVNLGDLLQIVRIFFLQADFRTNVTRSPQNEAEVAALYFELWLITDDLGQCGSIWVFCIFSDSKALSCMLLTHLSLSDIFNVQNGHFSQVSYI